MLKLLPISAGVAVLLLIGQANAQGIMRYDVCRDAYKGAHYSSDLLMDSDRRTAFRPSPRADDLYRTRAWPDCYYGEVVDSFRSFWAYQDDRQRRWRQEIDEADARLRMKDAEFKDEMNTFGGSRLEWFSRRREAPLP